MADDLSLAPLVISPGVVAAQARERAEETAAPTSDGRGGAVEDPAVERVRDLQAMFPEYDSEVLHSVFLTCNSNVEEAVQQLLEMGGETHRPGAEELPGDQLQSDEALALALFKQFAEDLEQQLSTPIPPEVRDDPVRYEAFIREQFERELAREGSALNSRFEGLYEDSGSASAEIKTDRQASILDRVKKMPSLFRSMRMNTVAVDDGARPLLLAEHDAVGGTSERV